jgi:hypothetical protein
MLSRRNVVATIGSLAFGTALDGAWRAASAMGTGFNFFGDCYALDLRGTNDQEIIIKNQDNPRYILEAIELVIYLADAYSIIKSDMSDSTQMMSDINSKLDQVLSTLSQVNAKMDQLIGLLQQLPLVIRGEVEMALVRQALGRADAVVRDMQDKLKPGLVDQYATVLEERAYDLTVELGGITGLRGASGVIVTAPYMSIWLAATVAAQKALKRADPNWKINSPWNRNFLKFTADVFSGLFPQAVQQDVTYATQIVPAMPPHRDNLALEGGALVKSDAGDYLLSCPTGLKGEKLLQGYQFAGYTEVTSGPAWNAYQTLLATREEIRSFYTIIPDLYKARDTLLNVFVEPEHIWDVNK